MSAAGPSEPSDGIEPGRRLVRVEAARGQSLAERIAAHVHRLAWRTPFHALRLRGRYPLKLLGVPSDPLPADADAGAALLAGRVEHRGEVVPLEDLDFRALPVSAAMAEHLHSFAWLRDLAVAGPREQVVPLAERLVEQWLAAHGLTVSQSVWRPDLCARRIFFWAAYAPLILPSTKIVYRSAVLTGLARQARRLDRTADKAPRGIRQIAAWTGVIAAGLLIPGGEARRLRGEEGLARAIEAGLGPDGGLYDRSPLNQLDLIETLAQLRAIYDMRRIEMPQAVSRVLVRAVPVLRGVMHADGGLSSWQGSGPCDPGRIATAIAIAGAPAATGRGDRLPEQWGYHCLDAGPLRLIVDAAPPPVQLVRWACASTLAFELSDGPERLIVNCGGPAGGLADFPAGLADALRATAAHSTLVVADTNSTATYADGSLGRGVTEVAFERAEGEAGIRLDASHDGYLKRFGLIHRRQLVLARDGGELAGEDVVEPAGRRAKKAHSLDVAVRFHLAPRVEATLTADGHGALLRIEDGPVWQFRCKGGRLEVEESLWVDESGWPRMTNQLVISANAAASDTIISWVLRRAA